MTGITRRSLLRSGLAGSALCVPGALAALRAFADDAGDAGSALPSLLESSPYVYVSPLRSNGEESTCHAEVWFAWIDGEVVMTVASERWKAKAIARGLDRARIWVGDHGRWKGVISNNEDFRSAPSFDARARSSRDTALGERLLAAYDRKYPAEIGRWRDKMRAGLADGTRVLTRYVPVAPLT